ncbi:MAG: hypothetical protein U0790_22550 [Isosphaeraceae bacterium]
MESMLHNIRRTTGSQPGGVDRRARWLASAFALVCMAPHARRLLHPSFFSDDVTRIAQLQTSSLQALLFQPFNEHIAPLFQLTSWTTWQLAGRHLPDAPLAFTVAALVPFALCLLLLHRVVLLEAGSSTTALAAVALFSLSAVPAEAYWWYSASSFTWALAWTLSTWLGMLGAVEPGVAPRVAGRGWAWAFASAAAAPAFSAIGLLAGPIGALRAIQAPHPPGRRVRGALVPLGGTFLYVGIASLFRFRSILAESVRQNGGLRDGLLCTLRAPVDVLLPGLLGLDNADRWLGWGPDLILAIVLLAGVAYRATRGAHRPLIVGGMACLLGGYLLTYCVRHVQDDHWLLEVSRYHLFPHCGLVLIVATCAGRWLVRFDGTSRSTLQAATGLALVLLLFQWSAMNHRANGYFFPDQAKTLEALERLDEICRRQRITRVQALAALDPIRPRWFPHDASALEMLADSVPEPGSPDVPIRGRLLDALSAADREALCGAMDASPYLARPGDLTGAEVVATSRLVRSFGAVPQGDGRWLARHRPSSLDFRWSVDGSPDALARAKFLSLQDIGAGDRVEIWWTWEGGGWSETRSIRLGPGSGAQRPADALRLDRLPHWSPARAGQVRVVVRSDRPVIVKAPRLLR